MKNLENAVKQLLVDNAIIDQRSTMQPMQGGRTNHVWKISNGVSLVCKLYSQDSHNPLFKNSPASEYKCLQQLNKNGLAPMPIAFVECSFGTVLVYDYIEGSVWRSGVRDVAMLLHNVHIQKAPDGLRCLPAGTVQLIQQTKKILESIPKEISTEILQIMPKTNCAAITATCLVHTDVVPGNIIRAKNSIFLIDWQCPGIGDPVDDLAVFMSPAMQFMYRGAPLDQNEQQNFIDAYPDKKTQERYWKMASVYHWRMAAYCAWKSSQGHKEYHKAMLLELEKLKQLR